MEEGNNFKTTLIRHHAISYKDQKIRESLRHEVKIETHLKKEVGCSRMYGAGKGELPGNRRTMSKGPVGKEAEQDTSEESPQ